MPLPRFSDLSTIVLTGLNNITSLTRIFSAIRSQTGVTLLPCSTCWFFPRRIPQCLTIRRIRYSAADGFPKPCSRGHAKKSKNQRRYALLETVHMNTCCSRCWLRSGSASFVNVSLCPVTRFRWSGGIQRATAGRIARNIGVFAYSAVPIQKHSGFNSAAKL